MKILSSGKCHIKHTPAQCQFCVLKAFLGAHISEQTAPKNLVKKFTLAQVLSL